MRAPRASLAAAAIAIAIGSSVGADARAQATDQPQQPVPDPSKLQLRAPTAFTWDKTLLRASFKYRDVVDKKVSDRLASGLNNVIAMRAYVFEEGKSEPVALAVRTCRVAYDLWDDVYRVTYIDEMGEHRVAAINVEGVLRRCAEVQDMAVVDQALLKKGGSYFLGVIVDVNPISPDMIEQIRRWVSRPTGSTSLSPGDALFGSFVGLFVRQIGTSDRTYVPDPGVRRPVKSTEESLPPVVVEKLGSLPAQPGVYLFKDKNGAVLYVGKAKSLRARVRSYFQEASSDNRIFIPFLRKHLADLDTIVTGGEKEAFILENNLIKEHHPRYNVKLRDDKDYLSLRLDAKAEWPKLDVVRRPQPDGAQYFGPYHSATAARRTLHLVNKHFQLRTCSDGEMKSRRRPCLQYQIKRCPAPCVYEVDKGWYDEQVDAVAKFLDGRHDELSRELRERMQGAARQMRFELAAVYRDQLLAIDKVREEQRVVTVDDDDRDVLGLYREGDLVELALLYVRAGKLADVATFSIKGTEVPEEEIVGAFLGQHYAQHDDGEGFVPVPNEIILPALPEGADGIAEWLAERAGRKVTLLVPQRGAKVDLLAMANENARHAFAEKRREGDDVQERLEQLQERLRLPTVPKRIECCDISHLGGGDTVGAIVAMKDGVPDKKHYRTFHVKSVKGGGAEGDDYAAMYEVLARRFRRGRTAKDGVPAPPPGGLPPIPDPSPPFGGEGSAEQAPVLTEKEARETAEQIDWELPDLFVVDGGKGQLNVALAAAHDLGIHGMPIVALAKEKENLMGETLVDRVYLPGQKNPINLKSHSASLFFLARARDEAHRFSNRARERLGKSKRMRSALDDVAGIGAPTKKALLRTLGSLAAVKRASDEELLAVPGVTARHVKALRKAFEGD